MSAPKIHLTIARSDSAHVQRLRGLNRPWNGVVCIRLRPDTRRIHPILSDLLAAMGIRNDVSGRPRNMQESMYHTVVWLLANQITDVIVTGAELLDPDHGRQLIQLAHVTGTALWLVGDHVISDSLLEVLEDWPIEPLNQAAFDKRWEPATTHDESERRDPGVCWPQHVPSSDFPVFIAEARRHLNGDDVAVVESAYWSCVATSKAALTQIKNVDADSVAQVLDLAVADAVSMSEVITTVRAVQAAAFTSGWFIQVNMRSLLANSGHTGRGVMQDPAALDRLRAYSQPYRAAACVLAAARVARGHTVAMRLDDVLPSGALSRQGSVPQDAWVYLRALRLERITSGAGPQDALFADARGEEITGRALTRAVDDAARELGLAIASVRTVKESRGRSWIDAVGVSVQPLGVVIDGGHT